MSQGDNRVEFCYTAEERSAVARELPGNPEATTTSLSESLDEIEILVLSGWF